MVRACADDLASQCDTGVIEAECTNTASYGGLDDGCDMNAAQKICVSAEGREIAASVPGAGCATCLNTAEAAWVADYGCPADKPTCVDANGDNPSLWYAGCQCVEFPYECINTAPHGGQDQMCNDETPICVGPGGKPIDSDCYGEACVKW